MAFGGFYFQHVAFKFVLSLLYLCIVTDMNDAQSITQAEFPDNPLDDGDRALFICRASNLGQNFVTIERTIFSRTEKLSVDQRILDAVDDNVYLAVFNNDDGSETYNLSIRGVYYLFDAATYTCKIETTGGQVLTERSAVLNINYDPDPNYDPRCSIVGSSENLSRSPGTEIRLGCHSSIGYPAVDISWSYRGCNEGRTLPTPQLTDSGAYFSELRVTLSEEDNRGEFICTISRSDGSFSSSCKRGPFMISGGKECDVTKVTTQPPSTMEVAKSLVTNQLPSTMEVAKSLVTTQPPSTMEGVKSLNSTGDHNDSNMVIGNGFIVCIGLLLTLVLFSPLVR